ncbi:exopolyphosphatase [Rhodococcus oxybenzonivorans]|uniref:Exopolyphosphatase n=1 Tax=Rhodococcus oxybenzonivorans TaxID=1990687 RepID=A0A2S2BWQ2_9NOCA|nr:NUDIX domain-containing protein [Rhodococcus oxybenzonivorans]AWK72984.1 exopolyphosphatase [Rhodococcus oxybenzonivorans]
MTFSALTIFVLALVAVVVLAIGLWAYGTANRLDRLHVRSDLSWQALDSALARRAVVVRAAAAAMDAPEARRLTALAARAERSERTDRESAENALSSALSLLDPEDLRPQLVAELADAEARVLIARRFHNDAVRDTLALRARRPVRWLHLGGTAPLPTYFEITERASAAAVADGLSLDSVRTSARVVLLDERGRVLLLRGHDPEIPDTYYWFTIGGAVEKGENLRAAAVREIAEETGYTASAESLRGPMWRRVAIFSWGGELIRSEELFFALQTEGFEPHHGGFTELEERTITGHRWCTADCVRELTAAGEAVYPRDLADLLEEAAAVAAAADNPEVRAIT